MPSSSRFGLTPSIALAAISLAVLFAVFLPAARIAADTGTGSISLTTFGSAATENFDSLANTGTTNSTLPAGWYLTEQGGGARDNEQYGADNGASTTGDIYSYGTTASTERAFGALRSGTLIPFIGAKFTNNTGGTITSLAVSYAGEEWRLGTAARTDRMDFQYSLNATNLTTGTYTDVDPLDFTTPNTTTVGAKDGNAAGNRTAISFTITGLNIANSTTFFIRLLDFDATSSDDGLAVDDFSVTPNGTGGGGSPSLSINDVTQAEGDSGMTIFSFTVSLSTPAGAGGVTFDIATQDNTAMVSNNDYVMKSLTGQSITSGNSTYMFDVTVNGDMTVEPNETFFVNVTNITGATVGDTQGVGTINNDDVTLTPIHDIQGTGASSPLSGSVTTTGIVTGVKSNGFFIQEPDASADANPLTSEGIFVFTSSAPPSAATVGNRAQVTGTISEFVPSADPLQPPLTELTSPTVVQLSTGNPLPAAIPLNATFPDPSGAHDQLERVEGMRVSAASLTVVGPTLGSVNEPNATATSTGVFYGVITGVARPFREAGIQSPDPPPMGTIPPIPRFDSNPERIRVDSDGLVGGSVLDVRTGAVVTGLVGPLDYAFRSYTILPDPGSMPIVDNLNAMTATPVTTPTGNEFTVASYNLERFFDTVNDPGIGEPVLTAVAFDNRLNKASLGIRNFLKFPDILGVVEVENLSTLQALAARISSNAMANAQPDPMYVAYLVEGNDIGGIDVGFLVKTSVVTGATPRVSVTSVTQENAGELFVNPNSSTELLNDRPPLRLNSTINFATTSFPVTVIVNHMRSLNDVSSLAAGSNGWATAGERVRAKRQKQAESVANLAQARQTANPAERIILVGDFNAFEFNDGFGDSMNVIQGTPPPDNQTAVPGDGVDLVTPDLMNLFNTAPASERYSFVFDGNAQSLDHIVVNQKLTADTLARRVEHPRINADFPETARNAVTSMEMNVERLADHDPIVGFFEVAMPCTITCPNNVTVSNETGQCGATVTYPAPTTSGPCGKIVCAPASGTFFPVGTTTVTCENQQVGNSNVKPAGPTPGACSFTVTVNDTQAPTITCPANITQPADKGQCSAVVTYNNATASDNCTGVGTPVCTPASGSTFPKGTTTVNCSVSDAAGNPASCSFTVTVNDTQPPSITCPANVTRSTDPNQCSAAAVTYPAPTVGDNCPNPGAPTCNPASGSTFPKGTTTVNCTVTDASGNNASCSFTVTVNDTEPPSVTCPANIVKNADPNQCSAVAGYTASANDNCPSVNLACSPASGSTFPKGTTTVTCTATDASGNMAICRFTVRVNDTQPPTITCPANVTSVTPTLGGSSAVVNYPAPTVTDNCPGATATCNPPSGSTFPTGCTTVACTATDTSGNTALCFFTVCIFNVCLQDNSSPNNRIVFNTATGDYRFCCNGVTYTGKGKMTVQGSTYTLEHNTLDRRLLARAMATGGGSGTATLQSPPGRLRCNITDSNSSNNTTCATCQ